MNKLKSISRNSKILSLSDSDFDGAVSQIVLANAFKNIECMKTTYTNIEETMRNVKYSDYDFVILTDISPADRTLFDLSDNIILLDHHDSALDLHCPEKMRSVISGRCSAFWAKDFCEKTLKIRLNHLNNLVYLCNDYDMWILRSPKSRFMNALFYKYFSERFQKRFFSGDTRFTPDEISYIRKKKKAFKAIYDNLEIYDFESVNACLIQASEFHNDLCHKLLTDEKYNIVFLRNPVSKRVSVRNNNPDIHIGNILKGLKDENGVSYGGGHKDAGGMFEPDIIKFQSKLEMIEKAIYKNSISARKN